MSGNGSDHRLGLARRRMVPAKQDHARHRRATERQQLPEVSVRRDQHAIVGDSTSHHLDVHMSSKARRHDVNRVMPGGRQQFGDERRQTLVRRGISRRGPQRQLTFPNGCGRALQRLANIAGPKVGTGI
ncbi:MAG: hypothetical protein R2705_08475 [Ilumatobacteraceae bacterium]